MEESEIKIEDDIQDGGQAVNGTPVGNLVGTNSYIDGAKSFILASGSASTAAGTSLASIQTAVRRFNNTFYSPLSTNVGPNNLTNKPLFLSDLLDLLDPTKDVGRIFLSLPIAQFKHLPDPSVLNLPTLLGGQYDSSDSSDSSDVSANPVYESSVQMPEPKSFSETPQTSEELPSLEVEEPISVGGSKSRKWSSHKKRRHTRIRTKKNRKL